MKFAAGAAADRRGRVDVAALECDAWKPLPCVQFFCWSCGTLTIGSKWLDDGSEAFEWVQPQAY
jgi:hypothetical protein